MGSRSTGSAKNGRRRETPYRADRENREISSLGAEGERNGAREIEIAPPKIREVGPHFPPRIPPALRSSCGDVHAFSSIGEPCGITARLIVHNFTSFLVSRIRGFELNLYLISRRLISDLPVCRRLRAISTISSEISSVARRRAHASSVIADLSPCYRNIR